MRLKCAWCNRDMEGKNTETHSIEETISHSICLSCMSEMDVFEEVNMSQIPAELSNSLPFGNATLDFSDMISTFTTEYFDDNTIKRAQTLVGKDYFRDIVPYLKTRKLGHVIGGLKRRKSEGHFEKHYILRYPERLLFIKLEITHSPSYKQTNVELVHVNQLDIRGQKQ